MSRTKYLLLLSTRTLLTMATSSGTTRRASHAGSWYTSSKTKLDEQLTTWLSAVRGGEFPHPSDVARDADGDGDGDGSSNRTSPETLPITEARAVIAPHAGYSYSGPPAAYAYKCIPSSAGIKRVFILGPSHHFYLNGCALSRCTSYATPLGSLKLDRRTIDEIHAKGGSSGSTKFDWMDIDQDEDEHSIEMHLPYVRKIFQGQDIEIVPILVGSIDAKKEAAYGKILAPYLADPENFFVISSDFCHWGSRFSYTYYKSTTDSDAPARKLSSSTRPDPGCPIHESIRALDNEGIQAITFGGTSGHQKQASQAQTEFTTYLQRTKNTICGRHPIGVLLGALATLERDQGVKAECRFTRYEQSSQCTSLHDSSVSYASAFVRFLK